MREWVCAFSSASGLPATALISRFYILVACQAPCIIAWSAPAAMVPQDAATWQILCGLCPRFHLEAVVATPPNDATIPPIFPVAMRTNVFHVRWAMLPTVVTKPVPAVWTTFVAKFAVKTTLTLIPTRLAFPFSDASIPYIFVAIIRHKQFVVCLDCGSPTHLVCHILLFLDNLATNHEVLDMSVCVSSVNSLVSPNSEISYSPICSFNFSTDLPSVDSFLSSTIDCSFNFPPVHFPILHSMFAALVPSPPFASPPRACPHSSQQLPLCPCTTNPLRVKICQLTCLPGQPQLIDRAFRQRECSIV